MHRRRPRLLKKWGRASSTTKRPLDESDELRASVIDQLPAWDERRARFVGLVAASRRHRTGDGRLMQYVTFEDETGLVESSLSPQGYALLGDVSSPGPWLVEGRVRQAQRATRVEVIDVRPFHERTRR